MSKLDTATDREMDEYLFTLDNIIERLSSEVERLRKELRQAKDRIAELGGTNKQDER